MLVAEYGILLAFSQLAQRFGNLMQGHAPQMIILTNPTFGSLQVMGMQDGFHKVRITEHMGVLRFVR
jgi:hypothetical protein